MYDEIIDAALALRIHADACRRPATVAWIVMRDRLNYPGKVVARLHNATSSPFVLLADTLAELQAQLPAGLVRSDPQRADPPDVLEIWSTAY